MKTTFKGILAAALLVGFQAVQAEGACMRHCAKVGAAGAAVALVNYNLLEDDKDADGAMARTWGIAGFITFAVDAWLRDGEEIKDERFSASCAATNFIAAAAVAGALFYGANYVAPKAYAAFNAATSGDSATVDGTDASKTKGGVKGMKSPMMPAPMMDKKK